MTNRLYNPICKGIIAVPSLLYLAYIGIYNEVYKAWNPWFAIPLTVLAIIGNLIAANYDLLPLLRALAEKEKALSTTNAEFQQFRAVSLEETNSLKALIVKFIERGVFHTDKLRDMLKQQHDFVCVIKSSEGLSDVWKELEKRNMDRMLPFTSVLHNLPGAIRPFERMDLYLIPIDRIPKQKEGSLHRWIDHLAQEARKARSAFLADIPRSVAKLAEPFSYKLIAFYVSKRSMATGSQNRKFNKEFVAALLHNQTKEDLQTLTDDFQAFISAKDLALRLEWHRFIKTSDKAALLAAKQSRIAEGFQKSGFLTIHDFVDQDQSAIAKPLYRALKPKLSEKQCQNLAKKIIEECSDTLATLRSAGVRV